MKKKNDLGWNEAISKNFEQEKKKNEMLDPSKSEMRYITDYARSIDKKAQLMENASQMAHQGVIDFETGQKILNTQKEAIKKDIKYLTRMLDFEREE